MNSLIKWFQSLLPYLRKVLFGDQSVKQTLKEHWFAWTAVVVSLILFIALLFITEQSTLIINRYIVQQTEYTALTDKINTLSPNGLDGIMNAVNLGREITTLKDENLHLKQQLADVELGCGDPPKTVIPIKPKAKPRVTTPSPTPSRGPRYERKPTKPPTTPRSSLEERLQALPEI